MVKVPLPQKKKKNRRNLACITFLIEKVDFYFSFLRIYSIQIHTPDLQDLRSKRKLCVACHSEN